MQISDWTQRFPAVISAAQRHSVLLVFLFLLLVSSVIEFSVFGSMIAVDNGILTVMGDTSLVIQRACHFFDDLSLDWLLKAYAMNDVPTEHIMASIYLTTGTLVAAFGNHYPVFVGFEFLIQQVMFASVGAIVFGVTRNPVAALVTVVLLATGAWLARSMGINPTSYSHTGIMTCALWAIYIAYRRGIATKSVAQLVALAALTLFSGFLILAGVIPILAAGFVSVALTLTFYRGSLRGLLRAFDWPLLAVLAGVSVLIAAAYAYGIAALGNPPPGDISLGHEAVDAPLALRLYTLLRMSVTSLLFPVAGADGQWRDFLWWPFMQDPTEYNHVPFILLALFPLIVFGLALRSAFAWTHRAAFVLLGAIYVLFVLVCFLSVDGRGNLSYGAPRYLMIPIGFWAATFGLALGLLLQQFKRLGTKTGISVLVIGLAVLLSFNHLRILVPALEETKTLRVIAYQDRPHLDWPQWCPLLGNSGKAVTPAP